MKDMVVGFCYSNDLQHVLLILKNKPDWQVGFLNGVGGKINDKEKVKNAMVREFFEEAGVLTTRRDWEHCIKYAFTDNDEEQYLVHFLAFLSDFSYDDMSKLTCPENEGEELRVIAVEDVGEYATIDNLQWLVPMLADVNISFMQPVFLWDEDHKRESRV